MQSQQATLFQTCPTPSIIYDPASLSIVKTNRATLDLYGYDEQEIYELSLFDLFPGDEKHTLMDAVDRFKEEEGNVGSWIQVDKNGHEFKVEIYVHSIAAEDHERRVAYIYNVHQFSKDELTYHLSNGPLGILYWNNEFQLEIVSELFTRWTGYTLEDLYGRNVRDLADQFVPHEHEHMVADKIKELAEGNKNNNSFELKIKAKDGDIVRAQIYNSAEYDEVGNLKSVLTMVENVTEKSQLRERQYWLTNIISQSPDFIAMIRPDNSFIYINQAGQDIIEWPEPMKMDNKSLKNVLSKEAFHQFKKEIRPHLDEKGLWKGDITMTRWDGSRLPASAVIMAHYKENMEVSHYSLICQDISTVEEQQRKLQLAMEGRNAGFWNFYPQSDTVELDPQWMKKSLGYPTRKSLYELDEFKELTHPEDISEMEKLFRAFRSEDVDHFEVKLRMKHHEGRWVWIKCRASQANQEISEPLRITGINQVID